MLKLPEVQRRAVTPLAKQDPYGPTRIANARAQALGQWGQAAVEVGKVFKMYSDRERQEEIRQATLAVHTADARFRATYGGQEEYDPTLIEDENFQEVAASLGLDDFDSPIPAHKMYSEWRTKNYDAAMQSASKGIQDARLRDMFLQEHESKRMTYYADDTVNANKQQIKYITDKTIRNVEAYRRTKNYDAARLEITSSMMPAARKEAALYDLTTDEQYDYFNEVIERRDIPVMERALKQLDPENPDGSVVSNITAQHQKEFANQLRTAIGREKDAINTSLMGAYKIQTDNLRRRIDDVWANKDVNLTDMQKEMASLQERNPVLVREAEWTLNNQPLVSAVLRETPAEQDLIYQSLKANTGGDLEKSYTVDQLKSAIDEGTRQRQIDVIKWSQDVGVTQFEPIDLSSPQTFIEGIGKRIPGIVALQEKYKSFTGFGDKAEAAAWGNHIENLNTADQLKLIGGLADTLGEYAAPFYEQFKENGIMGTAAIAGQLVAKDKANTSIARAILEGSRLSKENPVVRKQMQEADLDATIVTKFGTMFSGNRKHQALMAQAFKDAWAVMQDSDAVFKALVGDTITLDNGQTIQAPAPGMSYREYMNRLKTLPEGYWWQDTLRAYGYSPTELRDGIINGDLVQLGIEDGAAHLMNAEGDLVAQPDGVNPYVFKLDMSTPTVLDQQREQERQLREEQEKRAAEEKRQEAEEYFKKKPGVTKEQYEFQQKSKKDIGRNMLRGFNL